MSLGREMSGRAPFLAGFPENIGVTPARNASRSLSLMLAPEVNSGTGSTAWDQAYSPMI
jgi:hypothetical protein